LYIQSLLSSIVPDILEHLQDFPPSIIQLELGYGGAEITGDFIAFHGQRT
jgi:hypothetical protein